MRRLMVQIEVNGTCKYVGDITEKDYLSILSGLGRECLGAIMALKFETAIKTAQAELEENGFSGTDVILGQILKKGGIKNFISH